MFRLFQETCTLSTKNLCKGQIMEDYVQSCGKRFSFICYVGDGGNDFCPSLREVLIKKELEILISTTLTILLFSLKRWNMLTNIEWKFPNIYLFFIQTFPQRLSDQDITCVRAGYSLERYISKKESEGLVITAEKLLWTDANSIYQRLREKCIK